MDPHRVAPDTSPPHSVKEPKRYTTESKIIATSRHRQTPVSLFRFSALTFNGEWPQGTYSTEREGLSDSACSPSNTLLAALGAACRGAPGAPSARPSEPDPHARAVPEGSRQSALFDGISCCEPTLRTRGLHHQIGRVGRSVVRARLQWRSLLDGQDRIACSTTYIYSPKLAPVCQQDSGQPPSSLPWTVQLGRCIGFPATHYLAAEAPTSDAYSLLASAASGTHLGKRG